MADFYINDILLDIPPEQITVDRKSLNYRTQTLRTKSSVKTKSGYSQLMIMMNVKFTDSFNGFEKLRRLIAQLSVTPFCYVENQYLRDTILSGNDNKQMALALSNMNITKDNSSTNCIDVQFVFYWFNYSPYSRTFSFKQDIFSPIEVLSPAESKAWKLLYETELKKNNYIPVSKLSDDTVLKYSQYAMVSEKRYKTIQKDIKAYRKTIDMLSNYSPQNDVYDIQANTFGILESIVGPQRAEELSEDIFSNTTSMKPKDIQDTIKAILDPSTTTDPNYKILLDPTWKKVVLNDGSTPQVGSEITDDITTKNTRNILMSRVNSIRLGPDNNNIIVDGISISYQNILATIPMVGHDYPTFQHIGSIDSVVTLSMTTTNESGVRALSSFYSAIEEQAIKYKNIPQGHRSILIENSLVNMCGLRFFLNESINFHTVPGQPGTSKMVLQLINNPLDPSTQEDVIRENGYLANQDIRVAVGKILTSNLKLLDNAFQQTKLFNRTTDSGIEVRDRKRIQGSGILGFNVKYTENYYNYNKPEKGNEAFASLCKAYGLKLGELLVELVNLLGDRQNAPYKDNLEKDFFNKNDSEYISIEKLISDIRPIYDFKLLQDSKNYKRPTAFGGTRILDYDRLKNALLDLLNKWNAFAIEFLDNIILTHLSLPQFKSVQEALFASTFSSDVNAYPDFPLNEIVTELSNSDNPLYRNAIEDLKEKSSKLQLQQKGLNVSSLIGPDFYFYEHSKDALQEIMPRYILNKAKDIVIDNHSNPITGRDAIEKSWLEKIYENLTIGDDVRAAKIRGSINSETSGDESDKSFWKQANVALLNALRQVIRTGESTGFAADYLQDTTKQGLSCSILEDSIVLPALESNKDDTYLARRDSVTLVPTKYSEEAKHRFGIDSIEFLGEQAYKAPPPPPQKDKIIGDYLPIFNLPVDPTAVVTSGFGPRQLSNPKASTNHKGIDLALGGSNIDEGRAKTFGSPVYAAANGIVRRAPLYEGHYNMGRNGGHAIEIEHADGFKSIYMHLKWDEHLEKWASFIDNKDAHIRRLTVYGGEEIASIGKSGTVHPHLHFELKRKDEHVPPDDYIPNLKFVRPSERASNQRLMKKSTGPLVDIDPNNESLLTRSVDQLEKDLQNGQGYGMIRAYPTFRIYLIESDSGERKRFGFDDFYKYSAIKNIQIVRSRKNPADLAIIDMTNISGVLSNRNFSEDRKTSEGTGNNINRDTENENPINSFMMQPGIQIQIRLGYNSNVEELEKVFNGVITEVQFGERNELVRIVCQSFGIELVQNIHGISKGYGGFLSGSGRTSRILEEVMAFPEMVHFGRWQDGEQAFRSVLTNRFTINAQPEDDNIFAPTGSKGILGIFDSTPEYILYQNTAWDVFQEMCLKHPGYVAYPVPYEDTYGPRMTMFFGLPDQLYFARNATILEKNTKNKIKEVVEESKKQLKQNINQEAKDLLDANINPNVRKLKNAQLLDAYNNSKEATQYWIDRLNKQFSLDSGIIKPFRNYHVLTSSQHIVHNSIENSSYNTFNTVTLQYSDSGAEVDKDNKTIKFGNIETFTLRCDAGLRDEDVREAWAQYPNCVGYEMAKQYSVGLLKDTLAEGYRGSIVVIGNPRIKPHDISYIFDEYTDMFGPIVVEQVVHKFSQDTGFVTEITPDMTVHVNQLSTLSTSDAMGLISEHALKSIGLEPLSSINGLSGNTVSAFAGEALSKLAGGPPLGPVADMFFNSSENALGQGGVESQGGLVGTFIFKKLITRSQLAHPFRFSPLVHQGKPMIGGLPIKINGGSMTQGIGKWFNDRIEGTQLLLDDTYDKITNVNKWFNPQGSFRNYITGDK